MPRRELPAPTGFFGFWWSVLAARATPTALLAALGVGAVAGLRAEPGHHPVDSLLTLLPAVLLPFAVLAGHLTGGWRALAPRLAIAAGLALAVGGALVSSAGAGGLRVRPGQSVEAYERPVRGRPTPFHLGGQLRVELQDESAHLWLGVKEHEVGRAVLPLDGREVRLGPWSMAVRAVEPGDEPTRLRFRARPRAGGAPVEAALRSGETLELAPGVRVTAQRLVADFGGALGAAAQLQIDGPGGPETAWHFIDGPDLDARVGSAPWIVEPLSLESEPVLTLDVRRAGLPSLALAGWALVALGLLVAAGREVA